MALEKYTPNEIPTSTKFNALVDEVNSLSVNKYTKPSSGIPATDLAAGVIPDSAEDITYDSTLESHTTGSVGAKLLDLSLKVNVNRSTVASMPATLADNTIYTISTAVSGDVVVPSPTASEKGIVIVMTAGTVDSVTFSGSPKWVNEVVGTMESGKQYMLSILDGIYSMVELVTE